MGNRAIIKAAGEKVGLYLHWNGGNDSVGAFLEYCKLRGFRGFPDSDALARITQVCCNFFGGTLCARIFPMSGEDTEDESPGDNGIYIVKGWDIVKKIDGNNIHEGYDRKELLKCIDENQPERDRLGEEFLNGETIPRKEIKVGDMVFYQDLDGSFKKFKVVEINKDGVPVIDKYAPGNPNNLLREDYYRRAKDESAALN